MGISKCALIALLFFVGAGAQHHSASSQADPILIEVSWNVHDYDLHTVPTLQVVSNPLLARQFSPIYKQIFASLKQLNADYARYAVWFPYPKLAVAELDPPSGLAQCGNVGQDFPIHLSCQQRAG